MDKLKELILNDAKSIKVDLSWLVGKLILVTGHTGLIGQYVCAVLDNAGINYVTCGRNSYPMHYPYDCIIHLAGYGQPSKFMNDKLATISVNTATVIDLLNKLHPDGKFLFISTSEVYSGLDEYSITEDMIGNTNTDHVRACYIEAKRCGEAICYASGKDAKIARLSLAYGMGTKQGDGRVINQLIEKGIKNDKIELLDGGDSIRTYCYITDVVEMFFNILLHGREKCYNIGGESTISILDLARKIGESLHKDVVIPTVTKTLTGSPSIVNMSIDKYKQEFNKAWFVSLNEGLKKTIEYQKILYEQREK